MQGAATGVMSATSRGTFWCAGVGLAFGHQWLIVVGTQSKRHRGREVEGSGFLSR